MLTKIQAVEMWRETVLPFVKERYESDGIRDIPARSESWNDFTDMLCKDGDISDYQYGKWTHPPECG